MIGQAIGEGFTLALAHVFKASMKYFRTAKNPKVKPEELSAAREGLQEALDAFNKGTAGATNVSEEVYREILKTNGASPDLVERTIISLKAEAEGAGRPFEEILGQKIRGFEKPVPADVAAEFGFNPDGTPLVKDVEVPKVKPEDLIPTEFGGYPEAQPNVLFQGAETGAPKGATEFLNDGTAVIRAFETADPSTFIHEANSDVAVP